MSAYLFTISPTILVQLGLCTDDHIVTRIGITCLLGDMDIRNTLLVEVGSRLGVRSHAKIASAYIGSGVGLFNNPYAGNRKPIGLTEEQRRVASKHGDVHTAVEWYLK